MEMEETQLIVKPEPKIGMRPEMLLKTDLFIKESGFKKLFDCENTPPIKFWEEFYSVHKDKPYFKEMMNYLASGPSRFISLSGNDAISTTRLWVLNTRTIYGLGGKITKTGWHATDLKENSDRERGLVCWLFFQSC